MTLLLTLSLALAAEPTSSAPSDPVADAVTAELSRLSTGLELPDAGPPWLIRADLLTLDEDVWAWGGRGALFEHREGPTRQLGFEVRVGSEQVDNANFGAAWDDDGSGRAALVDSLEPDAVRRDVWRAVDDAYKDAVAALARREAARRRQDRDDHPDAYVYGEAATGYVPGVDAPDRRGDGALVDALVRDASRGYREIPWVLGAVQAHAQRGRRTVLDTRGTRVSEPVERAWITLSASTRAPDGQFAGVNRVHVASTVDQLPDGASLAAELHREAERLAAWRALPAQTEPFAGPVIFSGQAAAVLFHDVLLPRLQGTPQREPEDRDGGGGVVIYGASGSHEAPDVLAPQRRALPEGFSVVDDPTPRDGIGWTWDGEGVAGRPVTLVEDGVVRDHLMSRTPNRWLKGSNGHGWADWRGIARAQPSHTTVTAGRPLSDAKLLKRGLQLARQVGLDHVVVVRSVGERDPEARDDEAPIGPPGEVVRHYADGHEEPVRGYAWGDLDARTLRDIVAAGPSATVDLEVGRALQRITAPSALVEELELVPIEPGDRFEPRVPPPSVAAP